MNLDQFTIKSQEAIQAAQQLAVVSQHNQIDTSHILKGIFDVEENITDYIFKKVNINKQRIEEVLDAQLNSLPKVSGSSQVYLTSDANKVLANATQIAKKRGDEFVSIEILLLAILQNNDKTAQILKDAGLNAKDLEKGIEELRKGTKVNSQSADENYNSLGKYAKNLNDLAAKGKLDPVIGRDDEIRRVLQILSRRTKNNPILIGEPGVGKTAIAEGLAHRIVNGDVPENLKSKKIFSLDISALIAGAKFKGEFEERLKSVVKEVIDADGEIVLFIDEIHTLVGAGGGGESAMDAANILKPALARGELRAIGATTLNEYQKYIEKDKALERRFQKVMVEEPDTEDAISILRGLKERYEMHHKVRIKDEAIISAVELSQRYITDRFLPDKAIDLIDEAASKMRLEIDSVPEEIDEIERKIMQYEIEKEAIKRENDTNRLNAINETLAELQQSRTELRAKWQSEKDVVDTIQKEKQHIESLKLEAEQAERAGDYGKVAEIRYGKIKEAEEVLEKNQELLKEYNQSSRMVKEEVGTEDIAEVVSKWTGIPVKSMLQSEREKLLNLEAELHKRVVAQDEAISAVADAVRRNRAGLQDPKKPIGSFIFLGTTGVGKTELAKALAEFLFNDEKAMVRIDMSEYQEKHTVSRLIGAPPGYVGYDEGGQLTEAIRRRPYSVVLLDEIEKAHPDIFNILLQVLDDGRLTDNKGRVVNFRNTIIIMTSNIGSHIIQENFDNNFSADLESIYAETKNQVFEVLKKSLRPEFLNRIDEIIMFRPLGREDMRDIVNNIIFADVQKRLKDQGIDISATEEVLDWISELGFDPQFGARPLKRLVQKKILNELSKEILAGKIHRDQSILLKLDDKKQLVIENQ